MWTGSISRWRSWGRRLSWALLCSWPIATGAGATDQVNALSLGGTGPTWTDGITVACDSTHAVSISKTATSGTNAGKLITFTAGTPSVTTFNLPSPSVSAYGHATYLYCDASVIQVGGVAAPSAGRWLFSSTIAAPGTWTSRADVGTAVGGFSGVGGNDPGDYPYTFGFEYDNSGTATVQVYNWDYTNYDAQTLTVTASSVTTDPTRCSGIQVASTLYGFGCWSNTNNYRAGYNGTDTLNKFGSIDCDHAGGASWTARQAWVGNSRWFFLGDDGTDSWICAISWDGTTGNRVAAQSITGNLFRGGVYFGGEYLMWKTTGAAWTGGGASFSSYFSDRSSSSLDFTPDSGTILQVISGVDTDGDGDATDNLLAFFTSGNAAYYGEPSSSPSSSSSSAKQAPPFRALPFRFPEMP